MTEQSILDENITGRLEQALESDDPVVRTRAARALGEMGDECLHAAPMLARISLADRDSGVRAAAVGALSRIGSSPELLLANAVELLEHPDETVRARAGWAIGKLDPEVAARAIPELGERLATDEAIDGRFGAAWALGRIRSSDGDAVEILTRALDDREGDLRAEAARSLGRTGPAAASALSALVPLLADPDPLAREQAARAVGRIGGDTHGALEALHALTSDPIAYVRAAAAEALGRLGTPAAPGRPRDEQDAWVAAAPGVEELSRRLVEANDFGRAEAPWLLTKLGVRVAEVTKQLLVQALVDRDSDARWSALYALARIAERSPAVTMAIVRVLAHDGDPDVRAAAATALGALWHEAPNEALAALMSAANDEDALVREDAVEALALLGMAAAPARGAITRLLDDPHGGVRARAAETLAAIAPG